MIYLLMIIAFGYAIIEPYRMTYWRCLADAALAVILLLNIATMPAWGIWLVGLAAFILLAQAMDQAYTLYHSKRDWRIGDRS
jgi:type IV secretory pathway TrbD component